MEGNVKKVKSQKWWLNLGLMGLFILIFFSIVLKLKWRCHLRRIRFLGIGRRNFFWLFHYFMPDLIIDGEGNLTSGLDFKTRCSQDIILVSISKIVVEAGETHSLHIIVPSHAGSEYNFLDFWVKAEVAFSSSFDDRNV